jgi:dihydrofolate synthase / folylpolyglutamate synthase
MQNFKRYFDATTYLESLSNMPLKGNYMIDVRHAGRYLKRMKYFLSLIGNPHKEFKIIHITGTSGKGSVTNMVHEILREAGKKVGSFTSPSVSSSIERIKVGSQYISPDAYADIVDYLLPYIDEAHVNGPWGRPSYFEISLAMAFLYFKQMKCEWVILEVGLGGRYDATNCIQDPLITAITCIDYDHMHVLGRTLTKIATDKAGIIKNRSHFFTAEHRLQLLKLFEKTCTEKGAVFNPLIPSTDYKKNN